MAALTITAANLGVGSGAQVQSYEVGAAVSHGQVIYYDTANSDHRLADADALGTAKATAISITAASADGDFVIAIKRGPLVLGAILTKGTEYYLGTTAGTIVPKGDLTTGDFVTRLGIATSTSVLEVDIDATGVEL